MVKKLLYSILIALVICGGWSVLSLTIGEGQAGIGMFFALLLFLPLVLFIFIAWLIIAAFRKK